MIYIPLIYFSILLAYLYRRNKQFDLACYIVLLYGISAFFSVQIDLLHLRSFDTVHYDISFFACFAYCGLLTLCIIPIAIKSNVQFVHISPVKNESFLRKLAWISFSYFVFYSFMSTDSILTVLTSDMQRLRADLYSGSQEAGWMYSLPIIVRLPISFMNMLFGCPWILVFLAFYSLVIQKMHVKYFVLFLGASLIGPVGGVIGVDRSSTAYWLISIGACYVFFRRWMNSKQKRNVNILLTITASVFIAYLISLTIARFDTEYSGTDSQSSMIAYLGQSYINFCYFFDTYECPIPSLFRIFPLTSQYLFSYSGSTELNQVLTMMTGKTTWIFSSFIGDIIISSHNIVGVLYCFFFFFIAINVIRNNKQSNISQIYLYFLFSSVLFLGVFVYYYASSARTFSAVVFYFIIRYINKNSVAYSKQL